MSHISSGTAISYWYGIPELPLSWEREEFGLLVLCLCPQSHLRDQHITQINPILTAETEGKRVKMTVEALTAEKRTEGIGTESSRTLPTLPELALKPSSQC